MPNYDLAVGVDEATANHIAAAAWRKPGLRAGLFKGSEPTQVSGVNTTVAWEVLRVRPTLWLSREDS